MGIRPNSRTCTTATTDLPRSSTSADLNLPTPTHPPRRSARPAVRPPAEFTKFLRQKAAGCSCAALVAEAEGLPRLYVADRAGTFYHGLHHETLNLQTVIKEALGLGRLLVLGSGPRLDTSHNLGVKPTLSRWEDYLSLPDTRFALFDKQNQGLCSGVLADCVVAIRAVPAGYGGAPKRYDDIADISANDPTAVVVRDYGNETQHVNARFAVRWLGFTLRIRPEVPRPISEAAAAALFWLRGQGDGNGVVGLHVRRGDKVIGGGSSVVAGLAESTSVQSILRLLEVVAPEAGTVIYIMTNEWNPGFFEPLQEHYRLFLAKDVPMFRRLLAGCPNLPPGVEHNASDQCETIALYSIEETLLELLPVEHRVVTFKDRIPNRWRRSQRMPYLHPTGEWAPPTTRKWCKPRGERCYYHTHCCSRNCQFPVGEAIDIAGKCIAYYP